MIYFVVIATMFFNQFYQLLALNEFSFDSRNAATLLIYVLVMLIFYFQLRGYSVLGVSGKRFREALLTSLQTNSIPYEERMSSIVLNNNDQCELKIASWGSSTWLRLKHDPDGSMMPKILDGMRKNFADKPGDVDRYFGILQLVLCVAVVTIIIMLNFGF